MTFFQLLGIVVGLYALYAAATGRVYVKSGPGGRTVVRSESPGYFWVCVAIYLGLAIALVTVF
ncbi:MAG: hypothetical protein KF911_14010 [Pseudomonadales bacterium]|nr:hypothetical protein [Pseudomonadales bacterium]